MATPTGFLNTNLYRAYPFVSRDIVLTRSSDNEPVTLPLATIVDFGSMLGADVEYDPSEDKVYLSSITRDGDTFIFAIRSTATDANDWELLFTRDVTVAEFALEDTYPTVVSSLCPNRNFWEAFLITGQLAELAELLADGDSLVGDDAAYFEPCLSQSCYQQAVRSISLANMDRIHAKDSDICLEASSSSELPPPDYTPRVIREVARCLDGDIKLQAGYNCQLRADVADSRITIGAAIGAGAGEPCAEVPTYPDEVLYDGGPFYSGGPACDEIILSLNGVTGPNIKLQVGPGVRLQRVTAHSLQLIVDSNDFHVNFTS